MIFAIVWTIVICGLAALAHWAVGALHTPEPLGNLVRVGAVVIAIIIVVLLWLNVFGMGVGPPLLK